MDFGFGINEDKTNCVCLENAMMMKFLIFGKLALSRRAHSFTFLLPPSPSKAFHPFIAHFNPSPLQSRSQSQPPVLLILQYVLRHLSRLLVFGFASRKMFSKLSSHPKGSWALKISIHVLLPIILVGDIKSVLTLKKEWSLLSSKNLFDGSKYARFSPCLLRVSSI